MSSSQSRRTLAATEYEICRKILEAFGDANLMVQLDHTEVVVGSPTMHSDLVVNAGDPRAWPAPTDVRIKGRSVSG